MPGSRPRFPHERQQQMIAVITERRRIGTAELASLLGISLPTVRRDLTLLERAGLVARTHGGVVAREAVREEKGEPDLLESRRLRNNARRRIAQEAARRLGDGSVALLDAGATALALADALAGREVTVVTMDLKVAEAAATGRTQVHLVGGLVRNDHYSLSGSWARQMLSDMRADVFFFTPEGLAGPDLGARTCDDAELKRTAMGRAGRTIALVEANTFSAGVFAPVCPAAAVSEIISDRALKALPDALDGKVRRLTLV